MNRAKLSALCHLHGPNRIVIDIATILNKYHVNLQTAKIMTMGERVEDVFLIDGEALKDIPTTVAIEKDLLEVLTPEL